VPDVRALHLVPTVAAVALAIAMAGCGQAGEAPPRQAPAPPPTTTEASAHGLTIALPGGWQAAAQSLTPHLADPREELAVATFPLRYRETACAHVPGSALEDLGPGDAFVTLEERGRDPGSTWAGFPARPARFGPSLGGPSEASACSPTARFTDHWFTFSDAGLRVDPGVVPDWTSAG
jgi:predicted small lipoprotein YifL